MIPVFGDAIVSGDVNDVEGRGTCRYGHPMFSISICLAVVPDVFFEAKGYKVRDGYEQFYPKNIRTPWFALTKGCGEQDMELKLKSMPPDENFSLMLSIGINYGVIESPGEIAQAKYAGSAKVLTMA